MKLITFISFFLFINNVSSGVISHKESGVKRVVRDTYKHNHSPSTEYFSVPVVVLYEEGNRRDKSVDSDISSTKEKNLIKLSTKISVETEVTSIKPSSQKVPDTVEINEETTVSILEGDITITETNVTKTTNNSMDSDLKSLDKNDENKKYESHDQNEFIIPVAVVYDVEPENLQRRIKPRVTTKNKSINRQQRNKNTVKEISDVSDREEITTPKEIAKNENIKTGTFPKRTQTEPKSVIPILQSENYVFSHSGDFHYSYEGGDGTKAYERGELMSDKGGESVVGNFSYIGKDGNDYSLTYTADENGYRPVGAHLPTPPPIPPAIARALRYLATKPTDETVTESYS